MEESIYVVMTCWGQFEQVPETAGREYSSPVTGGAAGPGSVLFFYSKTYVCIHC